MNFRIINFISYIKHRLPSIAGGFLALVLIWQCALLDMNKAAIASSLNSLEPSTVMVAGLFNRTEGQVEEAAGTAQRNIGKVTGQAKGLGKQVEGRAKQDLSKAEKSLTKGQKSVEQRAKQDLGKTQNALEDTKNNIEKTTGKAIDNVKELFNQ
jgi:uncharacterized protein YjbJ (UPF0337 family)